jgi:hypothetical protein
MDKLRLAFRHKYVQGFISSLQGVLVSLSLYFILFIERSKELKLALFLGSFLITACFSYIIFFRLMPVYYKRFTKSTLVIMVVFTISVAAAMSISFITAANSFIHTRHTFELTPTGQQNDLSSGADVILFEIRDEDGDIIPFEKLDPDNTWENRQIDGLNALVAPGSQSEPISYQFYGNENVAIQVLLKSTSASGKVLVQIDSNEQLVDLFDGNEGDTILSFQVDYRIREKTGLFLIYFFGFLFLGLCFWGLWIIIELKTQNRLSKAAGDIQTVVQNSFSGKYQFTEQITDLNSTPKTKGMLIVLAVLLGTALLLILRFQNIIVYPLYADEFSYMYSYEYPLKYFVGIAYGYVMPALVFWTLPDLLIYRMVSFILDLVLVLMLTLATIKWTDKWSKNGIQSGQKRLFMVLGFTTVIIKYTYLRLTPGYVDIANWVTLIVAICLFGVLTNKSGKTPIFLMLISGIGVGLGFFAKQTTSVALVAVVFVGIAVIFSGSRRKSFRGVQLLGIFAAGVFLAVLLFFKFSMPLSVWLEGTNTALSEHSPAGYLGRYWREIENLLTVYLAGFYPILALTFFASLTNTLFSQRRIVRIISRIMVFAGAAVPVILLVLDHFWDERSSFVYLQQISSWFGIQVGSAYQYNFSLNFTNGTLAFIALGMILAGYLLGIAIDPQKTIGQKHFLWLVWVKREVWIVIATLLLLPFASVSGSSNPLLYYALQSSWTWVMVLIIAYALFHSRFTLFGNWLFVILPAILIFTHFSSAIVQLNDYHGGLLNTPLARLEYLPKGNHLLFPQPAAQTLEDSYSIMVQQGGFSPGDTVFSYSPLYISYFLGGVSPSGHTHWHPYFFTQGLDSICPMIQRGRSEFQNGAYIIEGYGGLPDEIINCLGTMGIAFPQDYIEIGRLMEPYTNEEVVFYAPRR